MRTIEIHCEDRIYEVDNIPADAKITYGGLRPDQPGAKTNTLRIYTSQNNQLAVFRNVEWFRDKSLNIKDIGPKKANWINDL